MMGFWLRYDFEKECKLLQSGTIKFLNCLNELQLLTMLVCFCPFRLNIFASYPGNLRNLGEGLGLGLQL